MRWLSNPFCFHVQVLILSRNVLETIFKHLVQPKILLCSSHLSSTHAVHLVQTTGETSWSVVLSFPLILYTSCVSHDMSCEHRRRVLWPPRWTAEGASATPYSELGRFVTLILLQTLKPMQNQIACGNRLPFVFRRLCCWHVGGHGGKRRPQRHELQQQRQQQEKKCRSWWTSKWNSKPHSMPSVRRRYLVRAQFTPLPWIRSVSLSWFPFIHLLISVFFSIYCLLNVAFLTGTTCTTPTVTLTGVHSGSSRMRWLCLGLLPVFFH